MVFNVLETFPSKSNPVLTFVKSRSITYTILSLDRTTNELPS